MSPTIKLPSKNITALAVSGTLLGASEYWHAKALFWLSLVVGIIAGISVIVILCIYTFKYIFAEGTPKCKK